MFLIASHFGTGDTRGGNISPFTHTHAHAGDSVRAPAPVLPEPAVHYPAGYARCARRGNRRALQGDGLYARQGTTDGEMALLKTINLISSVEPHVVLRCYTTLRSWFSAPPSFLPIAFREKVPIAVYLFQRNEWAASIVPSILAPNHSSLQVTHLKFLR